MAEAQAMEIQKQKVAGFAKRNTKEDKIKQEEKELEELKKAQHNEEEVVEKQEVEPEPENAEERSFKKRYGDLRRFAQKKEGDLQKQIDELKSQLDTATKQQIKLPKSEEELEAWATEYPDVAKIVETIAIKKSQEQAKELEDRIKKINDMQDDALREKAEVELLKKHPDFADIRDQDEFHNWVEAQPQWVQKALYENEHDAMSAARAIDLYKADMGITSKKSSKQIEKEAAKSIKVSSKESPEAMAEGSTFKESEVEKMQPAEYEAKQDAIIAAMRSGNFIYDLTGSAR
tara:strand:+ start:223 stop:1092 length:870 start_codon:yes stop_codon:yes gene_type:complete